MAFCADYQDSECGWTECGVTSSPSPYQHLVDHEYGQTPQNQIMQGPPNEPPRSQVYGIQLLHICFINIGYTFCML